MAPHATPRASISARPAGRLMLAALLPAAVLLAAAGCGDDSTPTPPRAPTTVVVTSSEELAHALETAVAGDTIQLRVEFTGAPFELARGYFLGPDTSPLRILGEAKAGPTRPVIVFADTTADGLAFVGHNGSVVANLDLQGGHRTILIKDSAVELSGLNVTSPTRDGVAVEGASSGSRIADCLFDRPGRFGVSTDGGAACVIEKCTVVHAGDCGLHINSNATVRANLVYAAKNFGMEFAVASLNPTVSCNDAYLSGATVGGLPANYHSEPPGRLTFSGNFEVDPRFCPEGYNLSPVSPIKPIDVGACGRIGARDVKDCLP